MSALQALSGASIALPGARAPVRGVRLGMRHLKHATVLALTALVLSVAVEDTYPSSMSLSVSAVVLKKVWVKLEYAPPVFNVTPEDIRRGYVDIPAPTVLTLRNNSADGFLFRFDLDPRVAAGAQLHGLPQPVSVGAGGASVPLPGHYRNGTRFELHWRVQLASGLAPGQHLWPVSMQVDPN
jgi:hypothetical protein